MLSEQGKGLLRAVKVSVKEMNESEPTEEVSRQRNNLSKATVSTMVVISLAGTCLLARWRAIHRRHDLYTGSRMERGKLNNDAGRNSKREKAQVYKHEAESTEALFSGGPSRSSVRPLVKARASEGLGLFSLYVLTTT